MTDSTIKEDFPECEIEFDQRFGNRDACYEYLAQIKWPNGFICEKCGNNTYWLSSQYLYICRKCERQHSLTAGTIMHRTRKPITYWFKAMWWFTTRKAGVNAVNLQELLGFGSYHSAWAWLQKKGSVRFAMIAKNYLAGLKSMNSSSVVKDPANVAEGLRVKPSLLLLLNEIRYKIRKPQTTTGKSAAFVYRWVWIVQHIPWKPL